MGNLAPVNFPSSYATDSAIAEIFKQSFVYARVGRHGISHKRSSGDMASNTPANKDPVWHNVPDRLTSSHEFDDLYVVFVVDIYITSIKVQR